jgi:hypothetical protein
MMLIPGLGRVTEDPDIGSYVSAPVTVPVLGNAPCRVVLDDYDDDPDPEQVHSAIRSFLAADQSVLRAAQPHVFRYYEDCRREGLTDLRIRSPADVWRHVQLGNEAMVGREPGSPHVYVSLECECDWEEEHGLHLVFENGSRVSRVGPCDGHLTNAHAYDDPRFSGVIYVDVESVTPPDAAPVPERKPWWKFW